MLIYPSWHEHDPLEIVSSVEKCIDGAVAAFEQQGHRIDSIKAIGITNQRETTVVWNNETGEPLYNAIVWTDTRTQALVRCRQTPESLWTSVIDISICWKAFMASQER